MPVEIERKFLIAKETWRTSVQRSIEIRQGYLCKDIERTVRIRTWDKDGKITVKGKSIRGARAEYEYDIPFDHAVEMLDSLCLPGVVHKRRHLIQIDEYTWEIDEFFDHNQGLLLAEVELPTIDAKLNLPDWIGLEVTTDHRFKNSHLASHIVDVESIRLSNS